MRLLIALLSLFALTLAPLGAAPAMAAPNHATACADHHQGNQSKHDAAMTDCIAKCCTATSAATPGEVLKITTSPAVPHPAYRVMHSAAPRSPPHPYEPPPPRIS